MRKVLFLSCIVLSILGCGGDNGDLPCFACPDSYYEQSSSSYYDPYRSSSSHYDPYPYYSSSSRQQSSSSMSSSSVNYTDKGNSISSYATKTIGSQTWMAENLNYKVAGAKCYGENGSSYSAAVQANCDKYGRLYDWATAMALPSSCNSSTCSGQVNTKHRGICPSGWHIPSDEDWDALMTAVGGSSTAGKHLKATSGWNSNGNGQDTYGFSALPGGHGDSGGYFYNVGDYGHWWSSQESNSDSAYGRGMDYDYEYANYDSLDKGYLFSVRCVQD